MTFSDVAIIGAGPYGLSAAAHLRTIKGLEIRVFGEPMSFWNDHMPAGMLLRSNWTASHIDSPNQSLTLENYQSETGDRVSRPVPLHSFVQYGLWCQRKAVPELERRKVIRTEQVSGGFRLEMQEGETVHARRVVVAAGIHPFARRPEQFKDLPSSLASHASDHRILSGFAGKRVLVVGGGQSALESGALLHESGAEVEIVARSRRIHWLQGGLSYALHHRLGKVTTRLLYAPTDVGPAGLSQLMARPALLGRLPRRLQNRLWKRCIRSAGAGWLVPRLRKTPITLGRSIISVTVSGERAHVRLDDGSERTVDHILLGTGYRVDLSRYSFLGEELKESISCVNGYPRLEQDFETSVPRLHILGAPAAWTFGPLLQFVSGTRFASRQLMRSLGAGGRERNHHDSD